MKKISIISSVVALALVAVAQADVTVNITGATAFRGAAHQAILAGFTSVTGYAHTGTSNTSASLNGAGQAIFVGSFPGITGTTTIRTSWSGSVEGIRDLVQNNNVNFLTSTALTQGTASGTQHYGVPAGTNPAPAKVSFSDVYPASSPYNVTSLFEQPAGVITFTFMGNASVSSAKLSNLTAQQFRGLLTNGSAPLSVFSGVAADTTPVYLTGRNDGSGTRTTVLAETGFPIAASVSQWKPTVASGAITTLQFWPAADGVNASIVWGNDIAGNGGFSSGGNLTTSLQSTSTAVQRKQANGTNIGTPTSLYLVGYQGTGDATTALAGGAKVIGYNGVTITPATPLSTTDVAKVTSGAYTLWGYEHLINKTGLSTDEQTFVDALFAGIPANIGASGIDIASMNVSRSDDGALVGP